MIPIFDLDDTLYLERNFVESGFHAVAIKLNYIFGWPVDESLKFMINVLDNEGRGFIFNRLLESRGAMSAKNVTYCINAYRFHKPQIKLKLTVRKVIESFNRKPYLVTDGHKIVQQNKIKSLDIESLFKGIYITHRYGLCYAKPSIYCFDLIRKRENCEWSDMFYVGDNPLKDFVNLNSLGVHTIRVKTGEYADVIAKKRFDAKYKINSLNELRTLIKDINN